MKPCRLFLVAVLVCLLAPAPAGADGPLAPKGRCANAQSTTAPHAQLRLAMRCLVNHARAHEGLRALPYTARLDRSADIKSYRMRNRCGGGQFTHRPCETSFRSTFTKAGYPRSATIGENLAWGAGSRGRPRAMMRAWLASPGHRANLLDPRWRDQGVWVSRPSKWLGHDDALVWVSQFGAGR